MLQYVNYRMRITILDGRVLVGTLMAFDRHLNLVGHRFWFLFLFVSCFSCRSFFCLSFLLSFLLPFFSLVFMIAFTSFLRVIGRQSASGTFL